MCCCAVLIFMSAMYHDLSWNIYKLAHINLIVLYHMHTTMYGTHQIQLKRDTRGTRKGNTCTRVFLVIYTQLHAMQITFVYRPTRVFTTCLHAKAIFARTRVCVC